MTETPEEKGPMVQVWIKRGTMLVNCEALEHDDPDHIYNQIKSQGFKPEDYGYRHPLEREFGEKSRGELIAEILDLRKEIVGRAFHGF